MRLGISVIVCTYNGAALLPETIRHVAQLQVRPDIDWEFIIVDNASTDDSAQVARTEWYKYRSTARFSLLTQPRQGLTYARELALEKSRYEFVLFCDDDNWLAPDYLNTAYDLMCAHPSIGVLGGYGELAFETTPPLWAIGLKSLASGPQAKTSGKVRQNVVYGAGFIMRKTAFNSITKAGFKPMLTDRKGQSLSAGGDYELCYAIALAGYDIWYEETLKFKHFMPASRINWSYCVRLYEEGAKSLEVLIPYRIRVNMNCKNPNAFEWQFTRVYLSHFKKLLPLLVRQVWLSPDSERAKANTLKLIALRAKLRSLRNFAAMKANFLKIIKFEQEELQYYKQLERALPTDTKPLQVL